MNFSKTASGRKSANRPYSTEQTIPSAQPSPPVYPFTDGPLVPTPIVNKLNPKMPPEFMARPQLITKPAEVKSPVRHEVEKRAALPIPASPANTNSDELERLRREIAQLKAEIQRLNEERTLIITDYEDKIRAMRQDSIPSKGRISDTEKNQLLEEIGRLKVAKSTLEHQLEEANALLKERDTLNMGRRLSDTEKNQLLEEIGKLRAAKMSLEHQLEDYHALLREREELHRIIEELKYRLAELDAANRGNAGMYGDLETLRTLLKQRDNEAAMRDAEYNRLIIELNELRGKSPNNDLAMILFMIEIERLHSLLSDRSAEMQEIVSGQQADLMAFERQLKEAFAMDKYQLEAELTRLRSRLVEAEHRVDPEEVSRLQAQLADRGSKIALLATEIERAHGAIADLQRKNEAMAIQFAQNDLRERVLALEIELQQTRFQLDQKDKEVETKKLGIEQEIRRRLEIEINRLRITEKSEWEVRLSQTVSERQGYEDKIIILGTEIERLNSLNRKLTEERDWYALKLKDVSAELDRFRDRPDMQSQILLLSTEIERLNQIIDVQTREAEAWRVKYSKLEMAKFEELQMIISQNAELSKRMSVSAGDSDRVMKMFKELEGEHTVLWSKYQTIAKELEHMRTHRDSYIGPVEESPRKTVMKQNIITKIQNISSENVGYEQNMSVTQNQNLGYNWNQGQNQNQSLNFNLNPQTSYTNEIRFSSVSGKDSNPYY